MTFRAADGDRLGNTEIKEIAAASREAAAIFLFARRIVRRSVASVIFAAGRGNIEAKLRGLPAPR